MKKFIILLLLALSAASMSGCSGIQGAADVTASPDRDVDVTASPDRGADGGVITPSFSADIVTPPPFSDVPVLIDSDFLSALHYPPGSDVIYIKQWNAVWRIESFDFLSDYPTLTNLIIEECEIAPGLVIPNVPSLRYLDITVPDALSMISENKQITSLFIEVDGETVSELAGFSHLNTLDFRDAPYLKDISALADCAELKIIGFNNAPIQSLMPLSGLVNLEHIQILREVYDNLPEEEREIFPVYDPMKYTGGVRVVLLTE